MDSSAWPWLSWASTKVTWTSEHAITPSSGSVTVTANGILSPNANVPPSGGTLIAMLGLVLPAVMTVLADVCRPVESNTVRRAV